MSNNVFRTSSHFTLHTEQDMIYLLWKHQNPWQQHCHHANICKQFWDHHNNYYIIMGNSTFKRTFQSHLDPDEIPTESKRSLIRCLCHSCFLWRPTVSILLYYNNGFGSTMYCWLWHVCLQVAWPVQVSLSVWYVCHQVAWPVQVSLSVWYVCHQVARPV